MWYQYILVGSTCFTYGMHIQWQLALGPPRYKDHLVVVHKKQTCQSNHKFPLAKKQPSQVRIGSLVNNRNFKLFYWHKIIAPSFTKNNNTTHNDIKLRREREKNNTCIIYTIYNEQYTWLGYL